MTDVELTTEDEEPIAPPGTSRWLLRDPEAAFNALPRLPKIVATVLAARGLQTRAQVDAFYRPELLGDPDPMLLPDMALAVQRVRRAIAEQELIALFGDFDVDGVTSLAVLSIGLKRLGANVTRYIPDRFTEGYGLNTSAVSHLAGRGASLIITADCGISSVPEVAHSNSLGVDVIILDHHSIPPELPAAVAAVNPKRANSEYGFDELAAVGVSYEFLRALYEALRLPFPVEDLIDLVGLGTVVDVAPLASVNRRLVVEGLRRMRAGARPGLMALSAVSGVETASVTSENFGFVLGPRLNAAGRLRHAKRALDLVLAPDIETARPMAEELNRLNRERRQMTEQAYALAEEILGECTDPLIMVGAPSMAAGIVGLVASRLAERWHRPAIAFQEMPNGTSRASARSIPAFDVVGAIRKEKDLLLKHGGHRAAAGFSVLTENVPILRERLINTAAEMLDAEDLQKEWIIDAEAGLQDLNGTEIRGLMQFEPCGNGNQRPILLSRNVQVVDTRRMGADKSHLRLRLRGGGLTWPAVAFRMGEADITGEVDVVYALKRDMRGPGVELEILDWAPSGVRKPLEHPTPRRA